MTDVNPTTPRVGGPTPPQTTPPITSTPPTTPPTPPPVSNNPILGAVAKLAGKLSPDAQALLASAALGQNTSGSPRSLGDV